jgi:RNA polymerase sigma factor (sigma-70 family)
MRAALTEKRQLDQDRRIAEIFARERTRLRNFIRRRVPDAGTAEDVLQDVFFALVQAERLMNPVEHAAAWLFQVARNRITDLFRQRRKQPLLAELGFVPGSAVSGGSAPDGSAPDGDEPTLDDLLPSADRGPEAAAARALLLEELEAALDELPSEQRAVFIAHELEGRSFQALAEETGVGVNTLLSRKRYAVLHLRERLQAIYDDTFED